MNSGKVFFRVSLKPQQRRNRHKLFKVNFTTEIKIKAYKGTHYCLIIHPNPSANGN